MSYILNKPLLNTGSTTYEIKDGILFVERLVRTNLTIDAYKKKTIDRLTYTEGFSYPVIVFGKDMGPMSKEVRDYLAGEGTINKLSRAFVVEKSQGKLQLQFFIQTNKQPIPIEVFDKMEDAINWSKQFKMGK